MRHCLLPMLCAFGLSSTAFADDRNTTDDLTAGTEAIKRSILLGPAFETLRELSDRFGPRLTSSPAYAHAAEWTAERFRSYQLDKVYFEEFEVPNGWQRGWAHGTIVTPVKTRLHVESVGWSPPTPPDGVKGKVLWLSDISADSIRAQATHIKDRVVMLDTDRIFANGTYAAVRPAQNAYALLAASGARALLLPNNTPGNLLGGHVDVLSGGKVLPLPMAEIGMEDAKLIRRLAERGPVEVQFSFQNRISSSLREPNVIAEIRGSQTPDEWILVGGHLDSWDYGSGASDNGAGTTFVLEAARAIAALATPPRRSIRFVLWGGEEAGQLGSLQYARKHAAELTNVVAVLNADTGAGRPRGWRLGDRLDLQAAMQPLADAHLRDLSAHEMLLATTCSTDHCAFLLRGIPTLNLLTDRTVYEQVIHRNGDTLDKVNAVDLKLGAAVVAVTAYVLAQHDTRIARHIVRDEVAGTLSRAGLLEGLTWLGRWPPGDVTQ